MVNIEVAECPKCHAPVIPSTDWFQCPYCGTFLRLKITSSGNTQFLIGELIGNKINIVGIGIVQAIQMAGRQTTDAIDRHSQSNVNVLDKVAATNYLTHLDKMLAKLEVEIRGLEQVGTKTTYLQELYVERDRIKQQIRRYEDLIDPEEAQRRTNQKSTSPIDSLHIALIFLILILSIALIVAVSKAVNCAQIWLPGPHSLAASSYLFLAQFFF